MFSDDTAFHDIWSLKVSKTTNVIINRVSYRPPSPISASPPPLEFLTAPRGAVPPTWEHCTSMFKYRHRCVSVIMRPAGYLINPHVAHSSAGVTMVANVAIATGPAFFRAPWSSAIHLIYYIIYKHGRSRKFFQRGQRQNFAYQFQVADDTMQMDVHKTLYPFYVTKKIHHVTITNTKIRFVGSNCQVYNDSLHSRQSADFQRRVLLFK